MEQAAVEIDGDEPTALYRFYDLAGVLLYVGITCNLPQRFKDHRGDKWWWSRVARKTVMLYGTRDDALDAEAAAIIAESPVHNIAGRLETGREAESQESKLKRLERKLAEAERLVRNPPVSYTLPSEVVAEIADYARKHGISPDEAFGKFLFGGMFKCAEEDLAAERAEVEALIASQGASLAR